MAQTWFGRVTARFRSKVWVDLVTWRRLRRVRAAVECLDRHRLHQLRDVKSAHLVSFGLQQTLQHPATRERIVQVKLVDPAHQREIGLRSRARQIVDAPPADTEHLCLPADVWRRLLGFPRRFDINPIVPWSRSAPRSRDAWRRVMFMASAAPVTLSRRSQTRCSVSARSSSRLLIFNTVIRHLEPKSPRGGSPVGHL